MKKAIVTGLWSLLLATVLTVPAFAQELVVGGQVVGVQISTEGVVVAGFSEIETESGTVSPAQSAGVHQGDLITAVNGSKVADAQLYRNFRRDQGSFRSAVDQSGFHCWQCILLWG